MPNPLHDTCISEERKTLRLPTIFLVHLNLKQLTIHEIHSNAELFRHNKIKTKYFTPAAIFTGILRIEWHRSLRCGQFTKITCSFRMSEKYSVKRANDETKKFNSWFHKKRLKIVILFLTISNTCFHKTLHLQITLRITQFFASLQLQYSNNEKKQMRWRSTEHD